jgi:glycosyltransferase involved in cell wall biosynthesis
MMQQLPKISIVTPSYNQGKFLEETIISILNQNYPNLEFIIMDGGSDDNSRDIIEKYKNRLSYWVSEPDNGQADALSRGFQKSTGDILAYINSDDYYIPGSLMKIADIFLRNPFVQWVVGQGYLIDEYGNLMKKRKYPPITMNNMLYLENCVFQPATFWRRDLYYFVGGINPKYSFSFDYDLFLRLLENSPPHIIKDEIAVFRIHSNSKTTSISSTGVKEHSLIRKDFFHQKGIKENPILSLMGKFYRKTAFIFDWL